MTIPKEIVEVAKLAGAVFSEEHTESCVRVAPEWVLGIAHYRKQLRHIISQQVSFDLFDGAGSVSKSERKCYSFKHYEDDWTATKQIKNVWKYQDHKKLEVGLFRIHENDNRTWPILDFEDVVDGNKIDIKDKKYQIYAVGYPRYLWKREIVKGYMVSINDMHVYADLERAVPGFSGGPVFSHDGKLLGIMVSNSDTAGAKNVKFTRISAISRYFSRKFASENGFSVWK